MSRDLNRNQPINAPSVGVITSYPINHFAITKSDSEDLARPCVVVAQGAGNVAVLPAGQGDAQTYYVPDGGHVPVVVRRVLNTGTTATGLVGVY
jgi:hypothetical protein